MKRLKNFLRRKFPGPYFFLARIKDKFFLERWGNYYDASDSTLHVPERCLVELAPKIPVHVTRFLNIGCGAGRDFIPFDGKFNLWGIDIVPESRIRWVRPFKNLRYEHMRAEDLTKKLERGEEDLSHTLVYTCGTLMYLSREYQQRFLNACRKCGCTNFIFEEFPLDSKISPDQKLHIPLEGFSKLLFRKEGEDLPTYVSLL